MKKSVDKSWFYLNREHELSLIPNFSLCIRPHWRWSGQKESFIMCLYQLTLSPIFDFCRSMFQSFFLGMIAASCPSREEEDDK